MLRIPFSSARVSVPASFTIQRSKDGLALLVFLTLFFNSFSVSTAFSASRTGLAGHWSFDEAAGITANDDSAKGNTGVLVNGPVWSIGQSGAALSFDGIDDYVEVAHSDSLNLTRALTISAWIYNQATHEPSLQESEYHVIAAKGWAPDAGGSWTLAWDRKTNALSFCVRKNTDDGVNCSWFDYGRLTNDWHLITALFNQGQISLYADGVLVTDPVSLGTAKIKTNTENVYIGGLPSSDRNSNDTDTWQGLIDEVNLYDTAVEPTQIATKSAPLRGQEKFDFSIASSGDLSVAPGSAATTNINTSLLSGTTKSVSFSVSGLPANVSGSFSTTSCSPSCSTILTLNAAGDSLPGNYPLTVTARAGGVRRSTSFNLTIATSASFDFKLTNAGDKSVAPGSSVINAIDATLVAGTSQTISLSASGLPPGTSASFSNVSCTPSCSTNLTLDASSSTPAGTYPITVTGTGGGVTKTTAFNLAVSSAGVATPTITPNGGTYTGSVSVTLQTSTAGASIYYTTDGSAPTQSSTLYSGAITLTSNAVIKAVAFKSGYNPSAQASASFIVSQPQASFDFSLTNSGNNTVTAGSSVTNAISATLVSGSAQAVTFSVSGLPSGASGAFSNASCSPTCSSTLTIASSSSTPGGSYPVTVSASGGGVTRTTSFTLTVSLPTVATPTINPNGGTYTGPVSVTLQTATTGASIYYTTDGSAPTQSSSLYTGAMTLTSNSVVKAIAFKSGYNPSSQASATFTIASAPKLTVTWQDNSSNEDNFQIERKTGTGGTYGLIATVLANITSYVDTTVTSGVTYCYRLRAVNSSTTSSYSSDACGTAP